jgi:hypothetical protein
MSDVADDMMTEHPDEKKRLVIQKINITTDDMDCLKSRLKTRYGIINKSSPLSNWKF